MVLFVAKWDILSQSIKDYAEWAKASIPKELSIPGVVEFRAYRPATGSSQVVATYEFKDMASWSSWYSHPDIQKLFDELRQFTTNVSTELWGPSPVVPEPIRP
jgi:hypothetical protein